MEPGHQLAALLDATRALAGASMPHALIGGLAVGIHAAVPRATIDVDLAIATSVSAERAARVLISSGFELRGHFPHSANFRHANGEPVQLAFDPGFDPMIARAEPIEVAGVRIPVVSRSDLIAMKERAARDPALRRSKALRDLADIELLREGAHDPDEGW
jgi:hypothetical protein